jgi:pimeloyl-ACP methyl ester carboxylesterase
LASLGYDVLALAHFGYPGRPDTLAYIEIEYFEQAITYACERFGVERVAVQGRSRGGDLALLLGSIFPERIAGVTCLVGYSHVIAGWMDGPEGWTIAPYTHGGRTVPYLKLAPPAIEPSVVEMTDDGVVWSGMPEYGRAQPAAEAAEIAVERADCPILLISGGVDAVWDCASASIRVVNRLRVAGYPHRYRHLLVEDMGHRVPFPQSITTMAYGAQHPLVDLFIKSGGRPEATARAAWPVWNELVEHYEACFQNKAPSGN